MSQVKGHPQRLFDWADELGKLLDQEEERRIGKSISPKDEIWKLLEMYCQCVMAWAATKDMLERKSGGK